jgi:predicted Ser/Thr protein kinase
LPHAHTLPSGQPVAQQIAQGSLGTGATLDAPVDDRATATDHPQPGEAIGHFIVRGRLGEGGMGVVLAGEDANLGRPVAIKLVRSNVEHPAYRARLLREAQAMARLEHPNVVKVYEIGEDKGRLFVAMELVDGVTLTDWLRHRTSWRDILAMFDQVGTGLAAAHRAGLVHRDFKPDNVLVDRQGRARVADFGLARLDREGDASPLAAPLTKTGVMMGTPGYMAPEQQFGGDVDARADQYSFCVALREALGGRPLDEARWIVVPAAVRTAIGRGLSYDSSERFGSIGELLAALRAGTEVPAPAQTPAKRTPPRVAIVAALATLVAGAAAAIVVMSRGAHTTAVADAHVDDPMMAAAKRTEQIIDQARAANDEAIRHALAAVSDASVDDRMAAAKAMVQDSVVAPPAPPKPVKPARPAKTVARDAGVTVAESDPPEHVELAPPEDDKLKNYEALRKPAAKVGNPEHLPLVRKVIHNLGYQGIDLAALDRDPAAMKRALADQLAGQTGIDAGITKVKLGMVARRTGDCTLAENLWRDDGLRGADADPAPLWAARSSLGFAICEVETNNADDAYHVVMKAWSLANDELKFVMAIIAYEVDDRQASHARMIKLVDSTDARVRAAMKLWLDGTGLVL